MAREIEDKFGNRIYRKNDSVFLELKAENNRTRKVGTIDGNVIRMSRSSKNHLFKKANAYGFNHTLLDRLKHVNVVDLRVDKTRYMIPIIDILQQGQFLLFKQQGFELQIFMTLKQLENYKV